VRSTTPVATQLPERRRNGALILSIMSTLADSAPTAPERTRTTSFVAKKVPRPSTATYRRALKASLACTLRPCVCSSSSPRRSAARYGPTSRSAHAITLSR